MIATLHKCFTYLLTYLLTYLHTNSQFSVVVVTEVEQVVKAIRQKGCNAAAHGRFNRIRQVAPMCTPCNIITHASLGPPESTTKTASGWVQPFLHTAEHFTTGRPFAPQNCPFPWVNLDPHLIRDFLGPLEPTIQTASRSVHPFLHERQSDRPTDRPRYSVCNNGPHLRIRSTAMRPMKIFYSPYLVENIK